MTVTIGNNADVTQNPICVAPEKITDGGWYLCETAMTGTILGVFKTYEYLQFMEIMAYSQEAIQMNFGVTFS